MKAIVVDDHAVVRRGLSQILKNMQEVTSVVEAANGNELIDRLNEAEYDIVVLDISMPGKSGLDVLKEIKTIKQNIRVLILSIHPEEQYAIRALKAGAAGYITKDSAPEELVVAVQRIMEGGKYISQSLAEKLAGSYDLSSPKLPHENLSDREFEVFKMIGSGQTVSNIAESLFLSVKTVSTYQSRIYEKTGLNSRSEITLYAIKNSLIE
ncbi:MAG: response regulator transcription factor [Ignavibacteria bacterium]|nr:response regulator transcription factor [Ignavibacteria bacterium]MBT8383889.1 response regulator transcription factor [Ignavibacteria bacterium]MBT8390644.1 response regulator transcription factor [Ignavibacteria bacterium]NNJ51711.1 response regulator transcription factor [Ignavibacteriaceae bacterium]NNL22267.1 response regulator transcription factor [Ignavibacteriaceae bacterium]